jgi:hypothetical protein
VWLCQCSFELTTLYGMNNNVQLCRAAHVAYYQALYATKTNSDAHGNLTNMFKAVTNCINREIEREALGDDVLPFVKGLRRANAAWFGNANAGNIGAPLASYLNLGHTIWTSAHGSAHIVISVARAYLDGRPLGVFTNSKTGTVSVPSILDYVHRPTCLF